MNNKQNKKTRLCVFDFDSTLANTPMKPGPNDDCRSWNRRDWWGSRASLVGPEDGGFYDGSMNEDIVKAFWEARNDPSTITAMATGRRSPVAYLVRNILRQHSLLGRRVIDDEKENELKWYRSLCADGKDVRSDDPEVVYGHLEFFTGDIVVNNKLGGTAGHKWEVGKRLAVEYGPFEIVEIWDDRKDHIELWKALLRDLLHRQHCLTQKAILHQVVPPSGNSLCYVVDVPVRI